MPLRIVHNPNIGKLLLVSGLALCLLQIWLPHYFLTGDGPCHVYNAQILHDLLAGKNTAFYSAFYSVVYKPNPNWLSTIAMALLMFMVNGVMAEKIFLTLYLLLFVTGFYLLLKKISGNHPYWLAVVFIFVFTHSLSKGFYNFSFSIAFYFWMVWSWLCFLEKKNVIICFLFLLFVAFIFFTHLLAFVFGAVTCASLVVSYALAYGKDGRGKRVTFFLKHAVFLSLFLAPFLILMKWFTEKEGGMQIQLYHHFRRLIELVQFRYVINVSHREDYFAAAAGILLLTLLVASLAVRFKNGLSIHKYDGFLLSLLFVSFVYLFFPEDFLGRLILISMRVQLFVFIGMTCVISYILPPGKMKNICGILLFACFTALSIVRMPCQLSASGAVADYVSGAQYIRPYSVVLPLDFSPGGKDKEGKTIGDRNWLFSHASQYMGTAKPLIILDNYEANMGYFPICWTDKANPYYHLSKDEGIEGHPPYAAIEEYKQTTGVNIDYVLMWCYDSSYLKNEHFRKLYAEINAGYHVVYTSPANRTILFEQNQMASVK